MSDDTRDTPVESVHTPQASANDYSLSTVTVRVENDGQWYEVEFKSKPQDVQAIMDSMAPPVFLDEYTDPREALIRTRPVRPRVNKFTFKAVPVADPETGVIYLKRTNPPG